MFSHIYITRIKCLVRDKETLFWTIGFSLILATLFSLTLSNISSSELFKKIPIAVVDNNEYQNNSTFRSALESASSSDTSKSTSTLFEVTLAARETADELLKNNKIKGYIILENGVQLVVKESGIHQSVIKSFIDDFTQRSAAVHTIYAKEPAAVQKAIAEASSNITYTKEASSSKAAPDTMLSFYYALIAMTCLYGSFWGMKEVVAVQANLSAQGARINMVPVHKLKIFGYSLCAAITIQLASILILILYMSLALKIDFGNQLGYIILACIAGCISGVMFGAVIGALNKLSEGHKIAILISVSMAMSFCSGLMVAEIKYIIYTTFPIIAYINPGNLIADSFYSLYYYSSHTRFFTNIGLLFAFSALFYLLTYFILRRQRYASI